MTFFFEADEDGWVLRQVELRGPEKIPTVAAALAEWPDADHDGLAAVHAYEAKYGTLSETPITAWDDGFPNVGINQAEFEAVSGSVVAHISRRARQNPSETAADRR